MKHGIRPILAAALACTAMAPCALQAQKIESVQVVPPKKGKDKIMPTVKPETIRTTDGAVPGSENAMHCPGNGFVQRVGAPPTAKDGASGQAWLDKIDAETDGFRGEALLEVAPNLRVHAPGGMHSGGWIQLRRGKGDDATLDANSAGGVHVEWNRFSGDLVIRTATGRFVGNCGRPH